VSQSTAVRGVSVGRNVESQAAYSAGGRRARACSRTFPQAGAEEASARLEVAARKERMKERTPRVEWAELLSRTFDFDVFACVRCGGRLKGIGVP